MTERAAKSTDTFALSRWQLELSVLAFLAAVLFVVVGFASESAGAHWFVGVVCAAGCILCVFICLPLHGLKLEHFRRA